MKPKLIFEDEYTLTDTRTKRIVEAITKRLLRDKKRYVKRTVYHG